MSPKAKTVFLILSCFVLGVIVGFVGERYYLGLRPSHRPDYAQARKAFAQRLHLDSLQLERVDSLMDSHRRKIEDIRKLFSEERDTLRADMRKLLNPDQNRIYDDFIKELDARRHESDHQPSR